MAGLGWLLSSSLGVAGCCRQSFEILSWFMLISHDFTWFIQSHRHIGLAACALIVAKQKQQVFVQDRMQVWWGAILAQETPHTCKMNLFPHPPALLGEECVTVERDWTLWVLQLPSLSAAKFDDTAAEAIQHHSKKAAPFAAVGLGWMESLLPHNTACVPAGTRELPALWA